MVRHRVEWIGSGMDGLMRSSKGQVRSGICEMGSSQKRGKRAEREERRGKRAERDERREKQEERIKKREERRKKREKRREEIIERRNTITINTRGPKDAKVRYQSVEWIQLESDLMA